MNLDHLNLFVRLASTQNISRAGADFGLSATVASNYITKLEAQLGVRLVHRTTRKVALTLEGQAFLPHAEDVLASVEGAKAAIGIGELALKGTLRISAPASFGRMHLVPALAQFLQQYPDLNVDLRLSDNIIDLVEGGFDVAIRNAPLKDSSLMAKKLAHDERILVAAPDYIARHGEPEHPNELIQHQCITLTNLNHWQFRDGKDKVALKVNTRLRLDNGEALRDACIAGIGITIGSRWSVYQALAEGKLKQVLKDYPLVSDSAIWVVYPSSRQLAPKVRAFIDYFSNHFKQPTWLS